MVVFVLCAQEAHRNGEDFGRQGDDVGAQIKEQGASGGRLFVHECAQVAGILGAHGSGGFDLERQEAQA